MGKNQSGQLWAGDIYELLSTKLTPPRLSGSLVERETLFARLDEGLERRVVLLSAPAGFGKTTLVRAWLASRQVDFPSVAWVSLDKGDNDPVRFWRYVLTACQIFQPEPGQQALDLLQRSQKPPFEAVLTLFINEMAQLSTTGMLVLEDYHVIDSPQIHETLNFLLAYLPDPLRLVLITRSDPPLHLARRRAHHDLYELRAADLRFSQEETTVFLSQALSFQLSAEAVTRLNQRTEGWVAGLQLLALALQGHQDEREIEQMLATFAGSQQHVLEYLVADVLSTQPEHIQLFLLQTSLLNRLTGSLCDAVTGREDSTRVLAQLAHANLFLSSLDGAGEWYRYHALFAEAMQHEARRRLGEDALRQFSTQASFWYEKHELRAEAIEAALIARDFARAADLIEPLTLPEYFQNEYYTFHRWFELLPADVLQTRPALCFTYAQILLFTSDRHAPATRVLVERPLLMAECVWQVEGNPMRLGQLLAFRSMISLWQDDFAHAYQAANEALKLLPEQEFFWRGSSMITFGMGEFFNGKLDCARQMYLDARILNELAGNTYGVRASISLLGDVDVAQGDLHQAAQLYRDVLASAEIEKDFTDQGAALYGLAALAYEWNDLATAERDAAQALALAESLREDELLLKSSLLLVQIQLAHGESAPASLHLTALAAQMQKWPRLLRVVYLFHTRFALDTGDLVTARARFNLCIPYGNTSTFSQQEQNALLNVRLLIAQGENAQALSQLLTWRDEARTRGRTRSLLEILLLQTLAHSAQKEGAQARYTLLQALTLARPQGYRRLFLDEGEALGNVLRTLLPEIREEPLAAYARTLLAAFFQEQVAITDATLQPAQDMFPFEPLSRQERRVLRLLAAGRSNPEIANELVVSVNTIKTQVQSIYHKLNVNSRQEARETARRLHLV